MSNIKLNEHLLTLAKPVTYLDIEINETLCGTTKLVFLQKYSPELTEFFLNLDLTFQQKLRLQFSTTFFSRTFNMVQQFGAILLKKIL